MNIVPHKPTTNKNTSKSLNAAEHELAAQTTGDPLAGLFPGRVTVTDAPPPRIIIGLNSGIEGKPSRANAPRLHKRTSFTATTIEPGELCDLQTVNGWAISPVYRNGKRAKANFVSAQILALDADDFEELDDTEAADALLSDPLIAHFATLVYSTASHTPDAPRYRVLFILDVPISNAPEFEHVAGFLAAQYPEADQSVTDAARCLYGNPGATVILNKPDQRLPLAFLKRLSSAHERTATPAPAQLASPDLDAHSGHQDAHEGRHELHRTDHLLPLIEARLNVHEGSYNAHGWAPCRCPFHDDQHHSATFSRARGGMLKCHAGCKPGPGDTSAGLNTFGAVDLARRLGIPTSAQNTPARADARLGEGTPNGGPQRAKSIEAEKPLPAGIFRVSAPPSFNLFTRAAELQKNKTGKGRRSHVYRLEPFQPALERDGVIPVYRALTARDLGRAALYRALAYAPLVAGEYARRALGEAVGVSARATRHYDKLARVSVQARIKRQKVTDQDGAQFALKRSDVPPNVWIESTSGTLFPATQSGFRRALQDSISHDGRAMAYRCQQGRNHYTPPERDDSPVGLPVQVRRALIQDGRTSEARLADALLLAGVRPGDQLTTKEIIEYGARYGLGEATIRRVLRKAPIGRPDMPDHATPHESASDTSAGGEGREHDTPTPLNDAPQPEATGASEARAPAPAGTAKPHEGHEAEPPPKPKRQTRPGERIGARSGRAVHHD